MPVYAFTAVIPGREDHVESGTVAARGEQEARNKLKSLGYEDVKLKKLTGVAALLKRFTADVR